MKLLSLIIGDIKNSFRSLHAGFEIQFHSLDNSASMEEFNPFCFAGLNGSGKSNVLEALASIFYHLEFCVSKYKPMNFEKHFNPQNCTPDAFTLQYLIGQHNNKPYALQYFNKVTIEKEIGKSPKMFIQDFPFTDTQEKIEVSLEPSKYNQDVEAAPGKTYLPDNIVGYSSGENEILSLPFIKSRLVHFDEYKNGAKVGYREYNEPENSLIYIDSNMSQAVLLANLIFENEETLKPLESEIGIVGLRSFRMNLNLHKLDFQKKNDSSTIFDHIEEKIDVLKKCATTWFKDDKVLWMDFFVDSNTKRAFRNHFKSSFDLFRLFQLLYELNANFISEDIKEDVYKSKGFYTDGKLPEASPEERVFHFLDYLILKKIKGEEKPKELLLREFSDGEHQFLHTMGICVMLKEHRTILLLDEPETHFNPSWRAKFIKILNESTTSGNKNIRNGAFNVHLLKDIILTSHSPFIISDCMPDKVIFFRRNKESKKVEALKAKELNFNTFGASVDYILQRFFGVKNLVSDYSLDKIKEVIKNGTEDDLREAIEFFGESSAKQFLYKELYKRTNKSNNGN